MSQVPQYLENNIDWLTLQWKTKVDQWKKDAMKQPQSQFHSKIDAVSLEPLKREGTIQLGGHSYNPSTVIELLKGLSQGGVSPQVGETNVSLDDFIRSTIIPDQVSDPSLILYVHDGTVVRPLTQAELNWFFSGSYDPSNHRPIEGLRDPQRAPISVPELIYLYNVFFKSSETRSGKSFMGGHGKTIKRKNAQRANKKYRPSSKRRHTRRRRTKHRRH